jgi:hypothetical protein
MTVSPVPDSLSEPRLRFSRRLLAICLVVIFVGSWVASQVQTSSGRVRVTEIRLPMQNGQWIVADLFREALPPGTPLIHQPDSTADALTRYFERHPEYDLGTSGGRRFLTTGTPGPQNDLVAAFWGAPLAFEAA